MTTPAGGDLDSALGDPGNAGWDLREVVPALIALGVGLYFVGNVAFLVLSLSGQFSMPAYEIWLQIASALRWADLTTSFMLLAAVALVWWQYGEWVGRDEESFSIDAGDVHVGRLRTLSKWIFAAFILIIASAVAEIVSSVVLGSLSPSGAPGWAVPIYSMFSALASGILAGVGVVALKRILSASTGESSSADLA